MSTIQTLRCKGMLLYSQPPHFYYPMTIYSIFAAASSLEPLINLPPFIETSAGVTPCVVSGAHHNLSGDGIKHGTSQDVLYIHV